MSFKKQQTLVNPHAHSLGCLEQSPLALLAELLCHMSERQNGKGRGGNKGAADKEQEDAASYFASKK